MPLKKIKQENKSDNEMTIDEIIMEARAEYAAGKLKSFNSAEELLEDLHK